MPQHSGAQRTSSPAEMWDVGARESEKAAVHGPAVREILVCAYTATTNYRTIANRVAIYTLYHTASYATTQNPRLEHDDGRSPTTTALPPLIGS